MQLENVSEEKDCCAILAIVIIELLAPSLWVRVEFTVHSKEICTSLLTFLILGRHVCSLARTM